VEAELDDPTGYVRDVIEFADRNIVLTGFMGSGKSTIGRAVAGLLRFEWIDTDRLIESRHGPIAEIFERLGEAMFRSIERNIAAEVSGRARHVISTGGRMLIDDTNVAALSATGRIFSIHVDEETLTRRLLASRTRRPLLETADPEATIHRLLAERRPHYRRFAQIASGESSAAETASRLADLILRDTRVDDGHDGLAVLPLADPGGEVVLVTDDPVGSIHGPALGLAEPVTDVDGGNGGRCAAILLGGRSVALRYADFLPDQRRVVVVPTTPDAMLERYPGATVIRDVATLQTLAPDRLTPHGIDGPDDVEGIIGFLDRLRR